MAATRLVAVVVNHGTPERTLRAVRSLECSRRAPDRILVVDQPEGARVSAAAGVEPRDSVEVDNGESALIGDGPDIKTGDPGGGNILPGEVAGKAITRRASVPRSTQKAASRARFASRACKNRVGVKEP